MHDRTPPLKIMLMRHDYIFCIFRTIVGYISLR